MKKVLCTLILFCAFFAFAEQNQILSLKDFTVNGDGIIKSNLDSFPLTINCSKESSTKTNNQGITLSSTLTLPDDWNGDVGIILYKNLMSCKVYVNDQLIDTIGRTGPNFFFQPYISRGVLVPQTALKKDNTVKFELWNDTGTYSVRMLKVTDKEDYQKSLLLYNFLDIQIPRFACVLLLFVSLYSLFMFVNYKKKREFLYLSLSSLAFSIYLLNVTIYDSKINYLLLKAFLYSCFPTSIFFIIPFFRNFFKIKSPKKFNYGVGILGVVLVIGYYFQKNTAALDTWQSIMLIYPVTALGYGAFGFFKSLKGNLKRNISTGLGLLVAILFSAYDMYNFMLNITPFILLQGLGFMGLIIGTFYSLSQEIASTNIQCVQFADELEKSKAHQDAILDHVKDASRKADSTGKILGSSIASVSTLVTQYLASIDQVNSNIQIQHDQVAANKANVASIFTAIDKMSEMVTQHKQYVDVTVSDVSSLTEGINKTDVLIKKSAGTIKKLTDVCTAANNDVADSSRLVDDLASYSKNIYEIVNSISELSQQTNVLAINAAIEAARSGAAGKGFSVVAGEIRSLASQSGDSANKISEILSTMVTKIENIQNQEALVSTHLKQVISENTETGKEIEDIFSVLESQLQQSNHISIIIGNLKETVSTIATQTADQKTSSEQLNHSLEVLSTITDSVLTASKEQHSSIEDLKNNLLKIRNASTENIGVIDELKQMLD